MKLEAKSDGQKKVVIFNCITPDQYQCIQVHYEEMKINRNRNNNIKHNCFHCALRLRLRSFVDEICSFYRTFKPIQFDILLESDLLMLLNIDWIVASVLTNHFGHGSFIARLSIGKPKSMLRLPNLIGL